MTISTIGTTLSQGITLGTGTYADVLTVTSAGAVYGSGEDAGVLGKDAGITLTNAGTLKGYDGVYLYNGNGTVVNQAGGFISGSQYGIDSGNIFSGGAGHAPSAIFNAGTINGGGDGVALYTGGNLTNTGSIHGGFIGVYIYGAATLFNSGTITGSNAHGAVRFNGPGDDRLILAPTARFYGYVGGSSGFNTVELTSSTSAGTIANFNGEYKNFHNIVLDSGAAWTIASNAAYDTFDLLGVTQANIVETEAGGALTFTAGTGELVVENEPEAVFTLSSDGAGGTKINYLPGAISTITTTLSTNIAFGTGNYNADLTVSNTGAVITPESGNYALTGAVAGVSLSNFGSIAGPGVGGVSLQSGGTVSNALSGVIAASGGHSGAVVIGGAPGLVTNAGTISDVFNGVVLYAGGDVENTGTITGGNNGVYIAGGGTVFNDGTITGRVSVGFSGNGADRLILTPRAVLTGTAYGGSGSNVLELASAASAGFIADLDDKFRYFSNIDLDAGANWTIAGDALNDTFDLTGITQNSVSDGYAGGALTFTGGGDRLMLDNVVQGEFTLASDGAGGTDIVYVPGAIATITTTLTAPITFGAGNYNADLTIANTGALIPSAEGAAYAAVANANGVRLTNFGTIHSGGDAVLLHGSGTLVNASGAQITNNFESGSGVFIDGAGLVENAGTIFGNSDGVALFAGGTIINTGSIQGNGNVAVYLAGGGTIENSGIIKGAHAVQFTGSEADRLIIAPGAVFQGSVSGGSGTNTLELAAGAGTIGGIGTQFTGFSQAVVDLDADWVLTGANSIASMSGYGTVILGNAAALTVTAGISQDLTVDFAGLAGTLALSDVPQDLAVIDDFASGDTIDLLGVTATEVAFTSDDLIFQVGGMNENLQITGRLSTSSFAFISDGHGGTEITDNIIETLTTTLNTGITLGSGQFLDRLFITPTGAVKTTGNNGIYSSDVAAHLINYGIVSGVNYAASFNSGGTILNAGTLAAHEAVRFVAGTGTLANSGVIKGSTDGVVLFGGGNVVNTGTIAGTANAGVYLKNGGTLTNSGTILGGVDAVQFKGAFADRLIDDPGAVFRGTVLGGTGANTLELGSAASTGTLTGLGTSFIGFSQITLDAGAHWLLDGANTLAPGTTLTNAGDLTLSSTTLTGLSSLVNDGNILLDPSFMQVQNLGGAGVVTLDSGSTLDVLGSISAGEKIIFAGTGAELQITDTASIAGTLSGAATIDITDLPFGNFISASFNSVSDLLGITFTGGNSPLELHGDFKGYELAAQGDGGTGTELTESPLCYLHGTQILTPTGSVMVETLAIGDAVVTRFGGIRRIKWLGRQSYRAEFIANNPAKWPVCITAGALEHGVPARDLYVSPGHSMLLADVLVLAENLVNGVTITQTRPAVAQHYVQLDLGTHDCVLAEGAWSETYADAPGQRAQFHNAAEYTASYPNEPPVAALTLCAPRPEQGPRLEAALRPIAARAADQTAPGTLEGWIDTISDWRIEGWARDPAHPNLPVLLEILNGEQRIGTALACEFRGDLALAGKGRCAFHFAPPSPLRAEARAMLTIRRAADGAALTGPGQLGQAAVGRLN